MSIAVRTVEIERKSGTETTSRAALIAAMSYAFDITEGQPPGHAARTCLIGMCLADALQFAAAERDSL